MNKLALLHLVLSLCSASKGLFMSAASANASDSTLQAYLQTAALACRPPWNISTSPQFLSSVAIQAVGDVRGSLYGAALDRMVPALACVPQLYVGTSIPRGDDFYCGDVLNSSFTAHAVGASASWRSLGRTAQNSTCGLQFARVTLACRTFTTSMLSA